MTDRMIQSFNDSIHYTEDLLTKNQNSKDKVSLSVGGSILKEYLITRGYSEKRIKTIQKELQDLQQYLRMLETQQML